MAIIHKVEVFIFSYFIYLFEFYIFNFIVFFLLPYFFHLKLKMDPHHLDVENLDFGIDACNKFNPFEDDEIPTSSSVFLSDLP